MNYNSKESRTVILKDFINIIDSKLNRNNLFFANKIISFNSNDERLLYISRCKELVYKLENSVYLTMTDFSLLNKLFIELGLNKDFDLNQYETFVTTNGIVTFAGKLNLDERQKDFIYVDGIQNPQEYEIDPLKYSYSELIYKLMKINRLVYRSTKKELYNGTIAKEDIKNNLVKTNNYGYPDIIDTLNHDSSTNEELCKKYARKIKIY